MKTPSICFSALLAAAVVLTSPLQASVVRNIGQTTITLETLFGSSLSPHSHVTVPATEHVRIVAAPALVRPNSGWFKNGTPIAGATEPVLVIDVAQPSDVGQYQYTFLGPHIPESGSQLLVLNVRPATTLVNLSTRGFVGQGDQTMIVGIVVGGPSQNTVPSTVLIRAVGPTLARFGVGGVLQEPKIAIFSADGKPYTGSFLYPLETGVITKEDHIEAVRKKVGAFPLDAGSKDATDLRPFPPGLYTIHITGVNNSTGNVLVETYEVIE